MDIQRFYEQHTELNSAITRFIEVVQQPENAILRDATIKHFEFTFELTWKILKTYLEYLGFTINSPREVLKKPFSVGIIPSVEEGDIRLKMLEDRNMIVHVYHEALIENIYQHIVAHYTVLLQNTAQKLNSLELK